MDSEEKMVDDIKDGLYDFEIPYEEGSWENFQKSYGEKLDKELRRRQKKPFIFLKYVSAAAVLIGVLVQIPWNLPEKSDVKHYKVAEHGKFATTDQKLGMPSMDESDTIGPLTPVSKTIARIGTARFVSKHRFTGNDVSNTGTNIKEGKVPLEQVEGASTPDLFISPTISEAETTFSNWREVPIASIDQKEEQKTIATDRWKFGVEVNSSLITDKFNVSAGVLTQFKVSEKIKFSTGLTYSRISAMHETDPVQLSYDTKMVGGESVIKAIDIPLTVVYEPAEGWYASVGVSALAVLEEDKIYRMKSEMLRENVVIDPENGTPEVVFEVVTNEYRERSTDTDFEGRNNLRYLNLSIGRKQRFNKRTDLLLEPFIKIPLGGLQRRDVNLLNSGIKVKVFM